MEALALSNNDDNPYVIVTDSYRCVIDETESTISITTELGSAAARKIAEFEAERAHIPISLIFFNEDIKSRTYVFRLGYPGCMEDAVDASEGDRYKDFTGRHTPGCPHSKKGSPATCSQCIAKAERLKLIALVKAGKL